VQRPEVSARPEEQPRGLALAASLEPVMVLQGELPRERQEA
jgi:hypothetical protein